MFPAVDSFLAKARRSVTHSRHYSQIEIDLMPTPFTMTIAAQQQLGDAFDVVIDKINKQDPPYRGDNEQIWCAYSPTSFEASVPQAYIDEFTWAVWDIVTHHCDLYVEKIAKPQKGE